jgi:hypothetical protein
MIKIVLSELLVTCTFLVSRLGLVMVGVVLMVGEWVVALGYRRCDEFVESDVKCVLVLGRKDLKGECILVAVMF